MSQFKVVVTSYPRNGGNAERLDALVDTGAAYTVAARSALAGLGCRPLRTQRVVPADGRVEEWTLSQVDIECEGRRAITPVPMGPLNGPTRLGTTTLEALGLGIDSLNRRLISVDVYLA